MKVLRALRSAEPTEPARWAAQRRELLTQSMLRRAGTAPTARSLELRARVYRLNIPVARDVVRAAASTPAEEERLNVAALAILMRLVMSYDVNAETEFRAVTVATLEHQLQRHRMRLTHV